MPSRTSPASARIDAKTMNGARTNGAAAKYANGHANGGASGNGAGQAGRLDKRKLLVALQSLKQGDFTARLNVEWQGLDGKIADTFNEVLDLNRRLAKELDRVNRVVGKEGKIGQRITLGHAEGSWSEAVESLNGLIDDLVWPTTEMSRVIGAVSNGDLSQTVITEYDGRPLRGEFLRAARAVNIMVNRLSSFASEVTRVAREVGMDGKLGGQAEVKGVNGTWKDLTDNVNFMAANLTSQVRGIAKVVTAVANGDLKQKLAFEAKGEIAATAGSINGMIDTLATFADRVTTVAREVGVEGKLGGQAKVPGASGTWKGLTDNVNRLAANLTGQVRAIAEVATAVTKGDLTRSIQVDAQGELEALKDTINQMIENLRETTQKNSEQDWLKINLAKFTQMLQGQKDLLTLAMRILAELAPVVAARHGVFYLMHTTEEEPTLKLMASYAYKERRLVATSFKLGEGLVGQCALEKERILLGNVPSDYILINGGLGEAPPLSIIVLPVLFEGQVKAVIELASFERFNATHQAFLEQLTESIGIALNTIEANMRTEGLLKQSQSLAQELQSQQEELQQTNDELEEKAKLLVEQNAEVERQNREVELAKQALEEKASQLALTSKYKSEFLANMSHELRTSLNSMLILAHQLSENPEKNLSSRQVRFARTIHGAGSDLLALINDILDLSKIESGTVTLDLSDVSFSDMRVYVERTFRHVAESKGLDFDVTLGEGLPRFMTTDVKRVQQVLKNLLANSFKFTERGKVELRIHGARGGWSPTHATLDRARAVVAFAVTDTGIGIHPDKQQLIFEAFQQADGTTSRRYGGTGLGLSISREIARLLGGEIKLVSKPGEVSTFTLYLPLDYAPTTRKADDHGSLPIVPALPAPYAPSGWKERERPVPVQMAAQVSVADLDAPRINAAPALEDDREAIIQDDKVVLIVEDDYHFAGLLRDLARDKGFKVVVAAWGNSALSLAHQYQPDAITLDMHLPDLDCWAVLARLKSDPATRHIPVHIISVEEDKERGLKQGALSFQTKPITRDALEHAFAAIGGFLERKQRALLIVKDDVIQRMSIMELLSGPDVEIESVETGAEALEKLRSRHFDCMIMDLMLPGMDGFAMIDQIKMEPELRAVPIVVYTGKEPTRKEDMRLREVAKAINIKDVRSPERLLDETAQFLHRARSDLPEHKQRMLEDLNHGDSLFQGKKVLVVDGDIRDIFAMTSLLERHGMEVITAENGRDAIEILQGKPGVDVVLMDIMMPEMDGYDTMRVIRQMPDYKALPIIALAAKAMRGDREKCIEAGASDYISKPVDTEQVLSRLRIWVYR